jgi:hypothetical protein
MIYFVGLACIIVMLSSCCCCCCFVTSCPLNNAISEESYNIPTTNKKTILIDTNITRRSHLLCKQDRCAKNVYADAAYAKNVYDARNAR